MRDKPLILLVDDDHELRFALSLRLKGHGYAVEMWNDGFNAIEMCRKYKPAIVVLDLEMPISGGLDVLREIKIAPDLQGQKVIMLSGRVSGRQESLELGARAFLAKPYGFNELLCTIEMLLRETAADTVSARPVASETR